MLFRRVDVDALRAAVMLTAFTIALPARDADV